MEFATQKDVERAEVLNWRGSSFGYGYLVPNASKMAKLIKNEKKLIGRLEAIAEKWQDPNVIKPFLKRILEIAPKSSYATAIRKGLNDGKYSMSPNSTFTGNKVERICYHTAFGFGRQGETI
jgi:hypothetical protein